MRWALDNLQLVIIAASTIAWWLTQNKQKSQPPPKHGERPGRTPIEFEEADSARQVRERMQQLREQRRQGDGGPVQAPARPKPKQDDIPPIWRELMGIPAEPEPEPMPPQPPVLPAQPMVSRQDKLEREMRELDVQRRKADAMAEHARSKSRSNSWGKTRSKTIAEPDGLSDLDFLATLRNPKSARRAIVLREVLGKPVALR
ncbi:MAG: hypothetical protein J6386_17315 [Candidatus Synoicihabitans palmerolidicus]|nr:hypothetical protein [Candidatus Synoicihabitans palmerolidicus]